MPFPGEDGAPVISMENVSLAGHTHDGGSAMPLARIAKAIAQAVDNRRCPVRSAGKLHGAAWACDLPSQRTVLTTASTWWPSGSTTKAA